MSNRLIILVHLQGKIHMGLLVLSVLADFTFVDFTHFLSVFIDHFFQRFEFFHRDTTVIVELIVRALDF